MKRIKACQTQRRHKRREKLPARAAIPFFGALLRRGLHGRGHAFINLKRENQRCKQLPAGSFFRLRNRPGGRNGRAGGHTEGVLFPSAGTGGRAVGHRRVFHAQALVYTPDGTRPIRAAAGALRQSKRLFGRFAFDGRERLADRLDQDLLGALDNVCRKIFKPR